MLKACAFAVTKSTTTCESSGYGYLQRAYSLGNDADLKDHADNVTNKLSEYYLQQAKRYLNKPLANGAGLAWPFLNKAFFYKASNLDEVRDELTRAASAYQMRSRLSVRVAFRDQTSRRDSGGFADQLANAIATGLDTSGLSVRVIRPGETPAVELAGRKGLIISGGPCSVYDPGSPTVDPAIFRGLDCKLRQR